MNASSGPVDKVTIRTALIKILIFFSHAGEGIDATLPPSKLKMPFLHSSFFQFFSDKMLLHKRINNHSSIIFLNRFWHTIQNSQSKNGASLQSGFLVKEKYLREKNSKFGIKLRYFCYGRQFCSSCNSDSTIVLYVFDSN